MATDFTPLKIYESALAASGTVEYPIMLVQLMLLHIYFYFFVTI